MFETLKEKYYFAIILSLIVLLLIPWGYYDTELFRHTFLYKKAALAVLGISTLISLYFNKSYLNLVLPLAVGGLALSSAYYLNGYIEKHFVLQVVYLEILRQIFLMPVEAKSFLKKINPYIVYALVLKGFLWSTGNYIHGGYFSSNLYSMFLFLFCLPEIKFKRYYNLILPGYFLIIAGSKSVYLGVVGILVYFLIEGLSLALKTKVLSRILSKLNILHSLAFAVFFAFCINVVLQNGALFPHTYARLHRESKIITLKNLKRRGLVPVKLEELKSDYESKQQALLTEHPVSPYKTTMVLRAVQYKAVFTNLGHISVIGDVNYILQRAYGFNPHNAPLDIIARLGLLFCLQMVFLYRKILMQINSPLFLAATFPALCLQPYGFTLGHGLVFFGLIAFIIKSEKDLA